MAFALVFGPSAYATFVRQASSSSDTGYAYGYGHTYETGVWSYGYGYGTWLAGGSSSDNGGGSDNGSSGTELSDAQAAPYYEQIIALLQQLLAFKRGGGAVNSCVNAKPVLSTGSRGVEVKALQSFLIAKANGSAAKKLAAAGATGYYGQVTKAALTEYQKSVGITPASGIYGKATATKIGCVK